MADVREIAALATELRDIAELTERFMQLRSAQAVAVRINPWLLIGDDVFDEYDHLWHSRWPPRFFDMRFTDGTAGMSWLPYRSHDEEGSRVSMSEIHERMESRPPFKKGSPIVLSLHVRGDSKSFKEELDIVNGLAREFPVPTYVEKRASARLQFAAGDKIVCGTNSGTIGGFVTDGHGKYYGLTCSHAVHSAARNSPVHDLSGNQVGVVRAFATPVAAVPGTVCTPLPARGVTACHVNRHDFALVEMSTPPLATGLGMPSSLHQGDIVNVAGASLRLQFQVRSVCIAMQIAWRGSDYCFAPLVELYPNSSTTAPGDSGAWGLTNQFATWSTVVVGADSISTFAIDARDAADWIDSSGLLARGGWSTH